MTQKLDVTVTLRTERGEEQFSARYDQSPRARARRSSTAVIAGRGAPAATAEDGSGHSPSPSRRATSGTHRPREHRSSRDCSDVASVLPLPRPQRSSRMGSSRVRVVVERPRLPGLDADAPSASASTATGHPRNHHDAASDRRRRYERHQGHRSHCQARVCSKRDHRRLLSLRSVHRPNRR